MSAALFCSVGLWCLLGAFREVVHVGVSVSLSESRLLSLAGSQQLLEKHLPFTPMTFILRIF